MKTLLHSLPLLLHSIAGQAFAQSAAPEKVLFAAPSPALTMLPLYFASDRGLFKKDGIEPVIVTIADRLQPTSGPKDESPC